MANRTVMHGVFCTLRRGVGGNLRWGRLGKADSAEKRAEPGPSRATVATSFTFGALEHKAQIASQPLHQPYLALAR